MIDGMESRRKFLKAAGTVGIVGLAGCSGNGDGDGDGDGGATTTEENGDTNTTEGSDGSAETVDWTIGTSTSDSATHASGVAMSQVVSNESDRINMSAQTTGGTAANPQLIDNGDIDVAQSTGWSVVRANTGGEPYGEPMSETMTQVLPFMSIEYFLIKRDAEELADIETVNDIPTDGSVSIAFGQRGGTNFFAGLDGMRLSGIENPEDKFNVRSLTWSDQGSALSDGRLDIGMGYTVSRAVITGWEQELDATTDLGVVDWGFSEQDIQDSPLPYLYLETPADIWESDLGTDVIPSLGVGYETIFPESISEDLGYEFTKTVLENIESVRSASSVLEGAGPEFTSEFMLRSTDAPVHPGAEKYMKENDLWSDDLTTLSDYQG